MLLAEWFAWWREMSPIKADEQLDAYLVHLLGDSGWTLDRESVLDSWRKVARRDAERYSSADWSEEPAGDPSAPGALRRQAHRVRDWLRLYYGASVSAA